MTNRTLLRSRPSRRLVVGLLAVAGAMLGWMYVTRIDHRLIGRWNVYHAHEHFQSIVLKSDRTGFIAHRVAVDQPIRWRSSGRIVSIYVTRSSFQGLAGWIEQSLCDIGCLPSPPAFRWYMENVKSSRIDAALLQPGEYEPARKATGLVLLRQAVDH